MNKELREKLQEFVSNNDELLNENFSFKWKEFLDKFNLKMNIIKFEIGYLIKFYYNNVIIFNEIIKNLNKMTINQIINKLLEKGK